jgi:hypothetical protein
MNNEWYSICSNGHVVINVYDDSGRVLRSESTNWMDAHHEHDHE